MVDLFSQTVISLSKQKFSLCRRSPEIVSFEFDRPLEHSFPGDFSLPEIEESNCALWLWQSSPEGAEKFEWAFYQMKDSKQIEKNFRMYLKDKTKVEYEIDTVYNTNFHGMYQIHSKIR